MGLISSSQYYRSVGLRDWCFAPALSWPRLSAFTHDQCILPETIVKLGIELGSNFTSSSTLGDAAGHGPIYDDDLSIPSPAIDFDMELPWFRLLRRRFCFVMMCTGLSQVQAHRAESKRRNALANGTNRE